MQAIQVEGLTRLYRNGRGVRNIDLAVSQGEVFGFLGPNGAGKTTLIRTLLGFLRPQAGRAHVLGLDAVAQSRSVRARVGYLPSDPALYEFLTGQQNVDFALAVRGVRDRSRVAYLADRLEVDLRRRMKTLSRGNKQKVALLIALAHDPELIILDEPTTGLDPLVQEAFASLIREEKARGKTVFMSSHVLSEVEALCDRVAIIRDGQIVAVDQVEHLKKQRVKHVAAEFRAAVPDLAATPGVRALEVHGRTVRFTFHGPIAPLVGALAGQDLVDLTVADPPLEEVFRAFYEGGGGR
ncbi:ABC-2 type transport system ATP-binding protein [Symbiobacterium terraclitae]|uniref:ABC-2 type transport system ATP-binding protein n=1 Tax=Symbiobacterium terraclitae TaxID=557451 RepID=A0ABS4JS05_9FIRM|nr:ABC transporter ATP-binding protein [Symbiobacterium terraclitae]MBP2017239.1 ABC-2 type transport system ATP-binding protein [Symbiobacterium terraclitae]